MQISNTLNAIRNAAARIVPQKKPVPAQAKPAVATQPKAQIQDAARRFAQVRNTSAFEGQVKDFSKVLGTSAALKATAATGKRSVDQQKVDHAYDAVTQGPGGADRLAHTLQSHDLSPEEKRALINKVATTKDGVHVLTGVENQHPRNRAYDNQKIISSALGDAYRHGALNDDNLRVLHDRLGPDASKDFASSLALDPRNVRPGGVTEAFGRQANAAGDKDSAAIAFSSSNSLIERNLKTPEAQRDAFNRVKSYADANKDAAKESEVAGPRRADFTLALGNLARLSANGNGFSQSQFQDYVAGLGDTLTNESITRSLQVPGDKHVGGPLELFGKVSENLAAKQDDAGDKQDWKVNAALSFTSSKELIHADLNSPQKAQDAFTTLKTELQDNYDDAKIAHKEGYGLLKYPALVQGSANLFEAKGKQILDQATGGDPSKAAELKDFLRETVFSPYSDNGAKQRIQGTLHDYIHDNLKAARSGDSGDHGRRVGTLLGTLQIAAQEGVNRAGKDGLSEADRENFIKETARGFVSTVIGVAADSAGPEAGFASSVATDPLLKKLLPDTDPQELQQQYENEFRNELQHDGVDTQQGQHKLDLLERIYDKLIERTEQRGGNPDRLQDTRDTLGQGYENVVSPWLTQQTGN
ncbi:MAG: hypothetical protein ACJ8AT_10070 [Hyalangium sp.]|uniref:hypothetical protein n=1 Tax=Hyalangium sp. TaxID=2028555 RepID=UPI00389A384F